jgi:hypothetical protein
MREAVNDYSDWRSTEIVIPPSYEVDLRRALIGPDGGESYLGAQAERFSLRNREGAAIRVASETESEAAKLKRELNRVERELEWTPAKITRRTQGALPNGVDLFKIVLLSGAAVVGMIVSNVVLSDYVLASASDFITDRVSAVLFATLPCLGAVAITRFETRLSLNARWLYNVAVFSLGMAALAIWTLTAALTYAPSPGGSLVLLSEGTGGRVVGIVLLLSTVLCDLMLGASLLSGVGDLLSANEHSEATANPHHAALFAEKLRLEQAISECADKRRDAQDYLNRAAIGRDLTRREAEHDLNCARELFTQGQNAMQAVFIALFLSSGEETS